MMCILIMPSRAMSVTRASVQAGKLLDVDVLDHLVIGQGTWNSLKECGLWDLRENQNSL
jgi:DNA repair protein RadC